MLIVTTKSYCSRMICMNTYVTLLLDMLEASQMIASLYGGVILDEVGPFLQLKVMKWSAYGYTFLFKQTIDLLWYFYDV